MKRMAWRVAMVSLALLVVGGGPAVPARIPPQALALSFVLDAAMSDKGLSLIHI